MRFENSIHIKLLESDKAQIDRITEKHPETYNNLSHFIRCAIRREIRRYSLKEDYEINLKDDGPE